MRDVFFGCRPSDITVMITVLVPIILRTGDTEQKRERRETHSKFCSENLKEFKCLERSRVGGFWGGGGAVLNTGTNPGVS